MPIPVNNVRRLPITPGSVMAIASRGEMIDPPGSMPLRLVSVTRPEDIQAPKPAMHPDPDGMGFAW